MTSLSYLVASILFCIFLQSTCHQYCRTFVFFFFFFNGCTHGISKFPGQGLNLRHSRCDLHCSCSNAQSFNPPFWTRDQIHTSTANRDAAVGFLTHCATVVTPARVYFLLTPLTECELHKSRGFVFVILLVFCLLLSLLVPGT